MQLLTKEIREELKKTQFIESNLGRGESKTRTDAIDEIVKAAKLDYPDKFIAEQ